MGSNPAGNTIESKGETMDHLFYMKKALSEAQKAYRLGEVPIGALLVKEGAIIAKDHNHREGSNDPTGHAEIRVIKKAAAMLKDWRLEETTLYVTLEPCPMCAGAILNARIPRLVFGAFDSKAGAVGTVINLLEDNRFNHQVEVIAGIMEEECKELMQQFFRERRK